MGDDLSLLRRDVLEIGGSIAAMSGCLSSGGDSADAETATVGDPDEAANVEGFAGGVVKTDHLLTESQSADVVVWKDEDGTVFADGADEIIARGDNFSAVVQAAVDSGASKIVIQDGHYVAPDPVNITTGTILEGMGTDTTIEVAGGAGFRVEGERGGSAPLAEDANSTDQFISVTDASPFDADNLVLVNTERTTEYRDQPYGEIRRITSVDDANGELELTAGGLFDKYRTANGAKAVAIDDVENVVIRDMAFVGTDQEAYRSGVVATYGQRILVENVLFRGLGHSGVIYLSTIYSAVNNCKMHDIRYEAGGVGYGVTLADAVRNVRVRNNVFHDTKNHCTTVGGTGSDGFPRLLNFESNEYYEDDADVHMGGVVQFSDNRFANAENGIISGADITYVTGCEFRNLEGDAYLNRGDPSEVVFNGCEFKDIDGMGVNLYDHPSGLRKLTMAGNDVNGVEGDVLRFRTPDGESCEFFGFTENVLTDCGSNVIQLGEIGDSVVQEVNVIGNHFEHVDGFVLAAGNISGAIRFLSNSMDRVGGSYAVTTNGAMTLATGNELRHYDNRGLLVKGPGLVAANTFAGGGNDAVLVYETSNVFVTNNKFDATSGTDINAIDATECKVVSNDVESGIDVPGPSNPVRRNFGYQTEDTGTYATSGSGASSYEIPHDLTEPAVVANVWAESADAAGRFYVSEKDADTITLTYESAPPSGSGNLAWGYEAKTHSH
jgi:hypothetical protein